MVNTKSQANGENRIEQTEFDRLADDDDNVSVDDHYSGNYFQENNSESKKF